jgi:hypothetical protein
VQIDKDKSIEGLPAFPDAPPPVWIIGSGMTSPIAKDGEMIAGVPGTLDLCEILIDALATNGELLTERLTRLKEAPRDTKDLIDLYSDACSAHRASDTLEHNIRRAVLQAAPSGKDQRLVPILTPEALERTVGVTGNVSYPWSVRRGIARLVDLITAHPNKSGHAIITTNFDPLISVAFNLNRAPHVRFSSDSDYPIDYFAASVPVVYHVHGYWARGTLLNLKDELEPKRRARLNASLTTLLSERQIYILGYSGWDDVVMTALNQALARGSRVDWLCYSRGEAFIEEMRRIRERLDVPGAKLRFVEGVDGDDYLDDAAAYMDKRNERTGRSRADDAAEFDKQKQRLEHEKLDLDNRLQEAYRNTARLESIEAKVDAALAAIPLIPSYLDDLRSKLASVSTALSELEAQFAAQRIDHAAAFASVKASLDAADSHFEILSPLRSQVEKLERHVTYCSDWLSGTRYSLFNGIRPPANPPAPPH